MEALNKGGLKLKRIKCVQCGKVFTLQDSEIEFFEKKGLSLPKRCKECREKNKTIKGGSYKAPRKNTYKKYYTNVRRPKAPDIISVFIIIAVVVTSGSFFFGGGMNGFVGFVDTVAFVGVILASRPKKLLIEEFDTSIFKYTFYDSEAMKKHYIKHHDDVNDEGMSTYLTKANLLISNPKALHKKSRDDGDDVYFYEATNEICIVASAGYIRTYFLASKRYFDKQ